MKMAVCFTYVLLSLVYLSIDDSTFLRISGGVNIITQIGFIGYLSFLMEANKKNDENERLFFSYLKYFSIGNCAYVIACLIFGIDWSIYNTDLMAYLLGIGFVAFLIHLALKRNDNSR